MWCYLSGTKTTRQLQQPDLEDALAWSCTLHWTGDVIGQEHDSLLICTIRPSAPPLSQKLRSTFPNAHRDWSIPGSTDFGPNSAPLPSFPLQKASDQPRRLCHPRADTFPWVFMANMVRYSALCSGLLEADWLNKPWLRMHKALDWTA